MINLKKIIKNNNHSHILIVGNKGYEYIINLLYSNEICKLKKYNINNKHYIYGKNHFEFDCNIICIKEIVDIIKPLLVNKYLSNKENQYIIIKNIHLINNNKHLIIKYLLDNFKYKYILCSNNSNINYILKSRLLVYKIKGNNLNHLVYLLTNTIYDIYKKCDYILLLNFLEKNLKNIISLNIKLNDILKEFLNIILKKAYIINKIKYKIINIYSDIECKYQCSYNKIIYYEYMYIYTYKLLYNSLYVYYIM